MCLNRTVHLQGQVLGKMCPMVGRNVYRSALTPKPGPVGGSVRDVNPPAGSHEKRPPLVRKKAYRQSAVVISTQKLYCPNRTMAGYAGHAPKCFFPPILYKPRPECSPFISIQPCQLWLPALRLAVANKDYFENCKVCLMNVNLTSLSCLVCVSVHMEVY